MKMITLQYTLFCTTGDYRPVSCLIKVTDIEHFKANPQDYQKKAITKICHQRYWTTADLKKYNYTQMKCRKYEKRVDK